MTMKGKIRVAFVINDFLVGGAQRMLSDVLRRIDRGEFEPVLITLFYWEGKDYFYDLVPADVPVHRLAFKGFWDIRSWLALYRMLRSLDADVVLSNLFFSNTVMRILSPLFRYKVVVVEHNTYVQKTKLHQMVDRILARLSARIVAVSNTVAAFTARQERIPREKFTVIHNGVDIEALRGECKKYDRGTVKKELGIGAETQVLLNVARLTTQKNPRLLLEGFAIFSRTHEDYVLVIVGGGEKWDALLKEEAKALGIDSRVLLMGTRKDVARFYAIADFFVSTSHIEGFGIAHAEALACGVPVLTTKTAGPDEMIREGENGYFISGSTAGAVAAGMEKMVSADLFVMRTKAAESAEAYGIGRTVAAYEDLFRAVLEH